jgi:hypothetical protein
VATVFSEGSASLSESSIMMMALSLVLTVCALWIIYKVSRMGHRESFLPQAPGPPTLPILGNIFSFPIHHPWYK